MDQAPLVAQLWQAVVRYANEHGVEATLAQVHACLAAWQGRQGRGHPMIDDQERLVLMAQHRVADADLRERVRHDRRYDPRVLAEAARRAIAAMPGATDLDGNGKAAERAVKRLTRKFNYFSFDDPKRGFEKGVWFA